MLGLGEGGGWGWWKCVKPNPNIVRIVNTIDIYGTSQSDNHGCYKQTFTVILLLVVFSCCNHTVTVVLLLADLSLRNDRKEGNVLFNDGLNTFYLLIYGVRHVMKDHSDCER